LADIAPPPRAKIRDEGGGARVTIRGRPSLGDFHTCPRKRERASCWPRAGGGPKRTKTERTEAGYHGWGPSGGPVKAVVRDKGRRKKWAEKEGKGLENEV